LLLENVHAGTVSIFRRATVCLSIAVDFVLIVDGSGLFIWCCEYPDRFSKFSSVSDQSNIQLEKDGGSSGLGGGDGAGYAGAGRGGQRAEQKEEEGQTGVFSACGDVGGPGSEWQRRYQRRAGGDCGAGR
jgi:hypothetical protein